MRRPLRSWLLLLGGVLASPWFGVAAQQSNACPIASGEPYLPCQVDRPPRADATSEGMTYPRWLGPSDLKGSLQVAFVVSRTGRVQPGSVTTADTTHNFLSYFVQNAIRHWTFEPGLKGADSVAVRLSQVVAFSIPPDPEVPRFDLSVLARDSTQDGVPRLVFGIQARDVDAIVRYTNAELLEAQRAALIAIAPEPVIGDRGQSRVTVCLTINRGTQEDAADAKTLAALTTTGRRAVIPRDCPYTYVRMVYDPKRRPPPGYIDPYIMTVNRVAAWNADVLVIQIDVEQGTRTDSYRCWPTRGQGTWHVRCDRFAAAIS